MALVIGVISGGRKSVISDMIPNNDIRINIEEEFSMNAKNSKEAVQNVADNSGDNELKASEVLARSELRKAIQSAKSAQIKLAKGSKNPHNAKNYMKSMNVQSVGKSVRGMGRR